MTDALERYTAWVAASNPENAIRTWPRVTLQADNTAGQRGPNRRERAAQINALKRAIERLFAVRLILESREYSETHGFRHASYFTYLIERES